MACISPVISVRIGEILLAMPKASGKHENRANQYASGKILTGEESSISVEEPKPQPKPIETKQEAAQKLFYRFFRCTAVVKQARDTSVTVL